MKQQQVHKSIDSFRMGLVLALRDVQSRGSKKTAMVGGEQDSKR